MLKTIDQPVTRVSRAVIKFSNARNVQPCEIYRQISVTDGEKTMTEPLYGAKIG